MSKLASTRKASTAKSCYFLLKLCLVILVLFVVIRYENDTTPAKSVVGYRPSKNNRVFCLIKSYLKSYNLKRPQTIYKVWGRKCDDYSFIMMIPPEYRSANWSLGQQVWLERPYKIIQPDLTFDETHENITSRIYYAFIAIYKRYPNFSWYYLVDDDTYVYLPNLVKFLKYKNPNELITYGYNHRMFGGFLSGGCGYVISRSAFKKISQRLIANFSACPNTGVDDVDVSRCLTDLGVPRGKTIDSQGRQRFYAYPFERFFIADKNDDNRVSFQYRKTISRGICCSDSFIAIHYMNQSRDVIRLDIAIELHHSMIKLYNKHTFKKREISFKDIMNTFYALKKYEIETHLN